MHPSLLPAFPGVRAIEQALDYGVKVIGSDGPLRRRGGGQRADRAAGGVRASICSGHRGRSRSAIHEVEHRLLPRAVRLIAAGRVRVDAGNPRIVARWPMTELSRGRRRVDRRPGEVRVRRALLSVSDKRGLVDFARGLAELGVEIVSTGGTATRARGGGDRDARRSRTTPASRRSSTAASRRSTRASTRGCSPCAPNADARRHAQRARDRADRPRLREPLPVRARGRPPRVSRTRR